MAGAWRSLRYDMGRRPVEPPAGGPDVTSTGMYTFGGQGWDFGSEPIELPVAGRAPEPRRQPRRAALVSALGLLTVLGAAGAYLVVVNGLVPLRDEKPAAAGTVAPAVPAVIADSGIADSGIGSSTPLPRRHRSRVATDPASPAPAPVAGGAGGAATMPPPATTRPVRTVKPTTPECVCNHPPVPTPTAPASAPSPTPSASASPSSSPSDTPSAGDSSGTSGESPEPGDGRKAGHRQWHH
jgi:hypothetical protein